MPRLKQAERRGNITVWVSGRLLSRTETFALCSDDAQQTRKTFFSSLNRHVRLAWVSRDGREAYYVQPACDFEGEVIPKKYSFVAFRFVKHHGREVLLSWCSSDECSGHGSRHHAQADSQGPDCLDQVKHDLTCPCFQDLLEAKTWGRQPKGLEWLQKHFRDAPERHQVSAVCLQLYTLPLS